ncbi:hypothetical protein GCM10022271_11750 [Corallibacter vietnamensis]|uniref:Restriction endonuclease n=1 Tax=Corallibacter vietnamensis TaxID=904130 RepID=A0ABP7H1W6_9FLAO
MNGIKYIQSKQQNWAKRQGFQLVGGTKPNRGEKNYVQDLSLNIFNNKLSAETQKCFDEGDGGETKDTATRLAKMKALHSSSALPVNVFQYWQEKDVSPILSACKLINKRPFNSNIQPNAVTFEQKFEISEDKKTFPRKPNLDVVIEHNNIVYAIESKFTEPYSKNIKGLSERYKTENSFWNGLTNLKKLASEISQNNSKFKYLDASQLIKHILGLKKQKGKTGFKLLYLWYDVVGMDGAEHRKEIEAFADIAKADRIHFRHITYQEVIINLSKNFYKGNEDYVDYLTDRYL